MSESAAIVHDKRTQWLMKRRECVGASDAAAVLGEHPTRKPGDVYLAKLGLAPDVDASIPMDWGQDLQGGVGRAYARTTGRKVHMYPIDDPELIIHPEFPFVGCTLDGDVHGSEENPAPADGVGNLETKATSDKGGRWERDDDGILHPPTEFVVQVQVQNACTGRAWGSLTAFTSMFKLPPWVDIKYDHELFGLMVPVFERFMDCVRKKTPPQETEWWSLDAVKRLYGIESGETVDLGESDLLMVRRWQGMAAQRLTDKKVEDELQTALRLRMGAASIAKLPDGTFLTLNTTKESFVAAHTRSAFRVLRHTKNAKGGKK